MPLCLSFSSRRGGSFKIGDEIEVEVRLRQGNSSMITVRVTAPKFMKINRIAKPTKGDSDGELQLLSDSGEPG